MRSLAKIGPSATAPELVESAPHSRIGPKKEEITMNNLPTGLRVPFRDAFIPLLREEVGTSRNPWDAPSDDTVFNLWSLAHTAANSQLNDSGLLWMITKLVSALSFRLYLINYISRPRVA